MSFSLGSITTLNVQSWDGFDYPEIATVTPLIGDGTGATGNAVIQSTALTLSEATISGTILDSSDLGTLRGYAQSKEEVNFTDDDSNVTAVRVFDLRVSRVYIDVWNYSCRLVESVA